MPLKFLPGWTPSISNGWRARSGAIDGHFHVRLAGAKPDFADEDVVQLDAVFAAERHLLRRRRCRQRVERDQPAAILAGARLLFLSCETHRDLLARLGAA